MRRSAKVLRFPAEQVQPHTQKWWDRQIVLALLIFVSLLLLHAPLLALPYFWDEAGYYVPAARDLLLHFQWIPTSTLSNAHPPLVMAWLALAWKSFGYHAAVTRVAMLVLSAFTLAGVYRLAKSVSNILVATASVVCTALFPVFFAQSSLAHLDMAAAGFTLWGVCAYSCGRHSRAAIWFSLAALSKETAILAPLALLTWEMLARFLPASLSQYRAAFPRTLWLIAPVAPLAIWFAYHYKVTGFIFGNPEFVRYNVSATLHPVRVLAAFAQRLWQLFGYMNLFVLTIVGVLAMTRKPLPIGDAPPSANGNGNPATQRPRISVPVQMTFAVIVFAYILALSVVGGAVLARYLLPIYPLVIIVLVSTIWRRLPMWHAFIAVVCFAFALALVFDPPYHFAPEDNLDYAEFVRLHQQAAEYLQAHPPSGRVLTAWPASDELTKPYLGYVRQPIQIVSIEDFSATQIMAARDQAELYDMALLFSTKYEPSGGFLIRLPFWETLQKRYFDYHTDVPPALAAEMLGGRIVWQQRVGGQWAAILQMDRAVNASLHIR